MGARRPGEWAIEAACLLGCLTLIREDRATIHSSGFATAAALTVVLVFCSDIAALVGRTASSRLAPLCLTISLPGLLSTGSPRTDVWAFAFAALVPVAILYAVEGLAASRLVDVVLVLVAAA